MTFCLRNQKQGLILRRSSGQLQKTAKRAFVSISSVEGRPPLSVPLAGIRCGQHGRDNLWVSFRVFCLVQDFSIICSKTKDPSVSLYCVLPAASCDQEISIPANRLLPAGKRASHSTGSLATLCVIHREYCEREAILQLSHANSDMETALKSFVPSQLDFLLHISLANVLAFQTLAVALQVQQLGQFKSFDPKNILVV